MSWWEVRSGSLPPAVGHSIFNSGTTKRGNASVLSRDSAPGPDPGLRKHKLNRNPVSPIVNSFLRSSFGVNGPPKCMTGAFSRFVDQNVPNQPADIGI